MQLRGDVPPEVMRLFEPMHAPVEDRVRSTHLVTLTIDGGAGGHEVVDLDRGTVGSAATVDALVELLVGHLMEVSATLHRSVLQLRAAALQLPDGSGVLVVDDDRSSRHAVVAALVARGARCVSPDRGVIAPGSRTAQAFPLPVRAHGVDGVPERFAPAAQISTVVWVTPAEGERRAPPPDPGPSTSPVQELTRPHGCGRLLVDHLSATPTPSRWCMRSAIWQLRRGSGR